MLPATAPGEVRVSWIAGLVVHARPGRADDVRHLLASAPGVETVAEQDAAFAVVLEARHPRDQERVHETLAAHPCVERAELVFQSTEVEES